MQIFSLDDGQTLDLPASTSEWLVVKEFWVGVLNKLAKFMVKYLGTKYESVEEQADILLQEVDVEAVARRTDTKPLLALLEIVLTCGVHCKLKENCVMQVLQLRKDQQQVMMSSIQRLKGKHQKPKSSSSSSSQSTSSTSSSGSSDSSINEKLESLRQSKEHAVSQLQHAQKTNAALSDRNSELVSLVTQLEDQLASMSVDYKHVKAQYDAITEKHASEAQKASGENLDLTSPLRFMASSKVATEENNQLKAKLSTQEKTISTLQTQLNALAPYVSKVRELEDEIEMLKEKSRSAEQIERVTRKFEAKSTELANALLKLKQLEDALEQAQKTSCDFEATARQVPQLKAKLDQYKAEMVTLHSKLADASVSAHSQTDVLALQEKLQSYALQCEQHAAIVASLEREKDSLVQALKSKPVTSAATAVQDSTASGAPAAITRKNSLAAECGRGSLQQFGKGGKLSEAAAQLERDLVAAKEETESVKLDLEDRLDTMTRLKDKFQADYVATSEQLRAAKTEVADLEEKLSTASNALMASKEENESISKQYTSLKDKLSSLESVVSSLEKESLEYKEKLVDSENKFEIAEADFNAKFDALNDQLTQSQDKLDQVQSKWEQSVEETRRLDSEKKFAQEELCEAQTRLETLTSDLAAQQDANQSLEAELDELKHVKAQLDGQIANGEMELAALQEELQERMDRELAAVESSLSLQNEVSNLNALVESRDAELTTMQHELEKARANEELISVIGALRNQVVHQKKMIKTQQEEQRAIVASYHNLGMELLQLKIGGIPTPESAITSSPAKFSNASTTLLTMTPTKMRGTSAAKSAKVGMKSTLDFTKGLVSPTSAKGISPLKSRVPLREQKLNQIQSINADEPTIKQRRMTMAQSALERRPRNSLVASALAKR